MTYIKDIEVLRYISQKGFVTLEDLESKFPEDDLTKILEKFESLDYIAWGRNDRGQQTLKVTKKGNEAINIFDKPSFIEKIINFILFNRVWSNILGNIE